jgi:hypothetical protein
MALQTSASEMGAMDTNQKIEKRGESHRVMVIVNRKCLAKASANALSSTKCALSTSS